MATNTTRGSSIFNRMLLSQYSNSTRLKEYIMAFISEMDTLFATTQEVYEGRFLENASGRSLDIIGEILQQSRSLVISKHFFGFFGHPASESFGDEGNLSVGGYFRSNEETVDDNQPLSDDAYRKILLVRAYCLIKKSGSYNPNNIGGSLFKYPRDFAEDVNDIKNHVTPEGIYDIIHLVVLGRKRLVDPSEEVLVLSLIDGSGQVSVILDATKVSDYDMDILEAIKTWFIPAGVELILNKL